MQDRKKISEMNSNGDKIPLVAIVGSPNVGKSVLFNFLTGKYVTVSNYPGTTVEVTYGITFIDGKRIRIIDTPGMYTLLPLTEEERVARDILVKENPDLVIHVIDAKNLGRMLPLTLQLLDTGFKVIVVLNMMDEAYRQGIRISFNKLQAFIRTPVAPAVLTRRKGIKRLRGYIMEALSSKENSAKDFFISGKIGDLYLDIYKEISELQLPHYNLFALAFLLMLKDQYWLEFLSGYDSSKAEIISKKIEKLHSLFPLNLFFYITQIYWIKSHEIYSSVVHTIRTKESFKNKIERWTLKPMVGFPIFILFAYFGLYKFVAQFGAGVVVDLFERLFEIYISQPVYKVITEHISWQPLTELMVGEYGIINFALKYAVALILPIVLIFFFVFAVLEDSGFLPRFAILTDKIFKKVGLTGRAFIPTILGFGCDTMATVVTRTLPTVRERILMTLLLSLAVPCSAQLGVILGILHQYRLAVGVWTTVIITVFFITGVIAKYLIPGEMSVFYIELPPLRFPLLSNVVMKTYTHTKWYIVEVIPLFILASFLIWFLNQFHIFNLIVSLFRFPSHWMGLPDSFGAILIFGFFRRDYGAAGLYNMSKSGMLTERQLIVASVVLTLFLPCIAQLIINFKERGWKTGIGIMLTVVMISFTVGVLLNIILVKVGI